MYYMFLLITDFFCIDSAEGKSYPHRLNVRTNPFSIESAMDHFDLVYKPSHKKSRVSAEMEKISILSQREYDLLALPETT